MEDVQKTLLSCLRMSRSCDVFVLNDGAHRYRDALAVSSVMADHSIQNDARIRGVLAHPEQIPKHDYDAYILRQLRDLIEPGRGTVRDAIVVGRLELFHGELRRLLQETLRPRIPWEMDPWPVINDDFEEYRIIATTLGRVRELGAPKKLPPSGNVPPSVPSFDLAALFAGIQGLPDGGRRRVVVIEGTSALGTIGGAKILTSPAHLTQPSMEFDAIASIKSIKFRMTHTSTFGLLQTLGEQARDVLPWHLDDIRVNSKSKFAVAVAPLVKVRGGYSFLGRRLTIRRNPQCWHALLGAMIEKPSQWIDFKSTFHNVVPRPAEGAVGVGRTIVNSLVQQGVYVERDGTGRCRQIASI